MSNSIATSHEFLVPQKHKDSSNTNNPSSMSKKVLLILISFLIIAGGAFYKTKQSNTGAPPYDILDEQPPTQLDPYEWLDDWKRPDGPIRVGIQVGHWKNSELPEELARLIGSTGSSGGGKSEWEVNKAIADHTAQILKGHGIEVDIIPATVPPKYWADVFVAIHADGNASSLLSGYKGAAPRRDFTGLAQSLVDHLETSYSDITKMQIDPAGPSRNMRGYYAFAWWRYEHSVHPMTVSAIFETGFLTSPKDRRIIAQNPQLAALGLSQGIITFLQTQNLIKS